LVGSCRNDDDHKLKNKLEELADEQGVGDKIEFHVNLSQDDLIRLMAKAKVGVHTMRDEHFGISIVEMMAAGIVTIAHSSGGPLMDIIKEDAQRGYLAKTEYEYAETMEQALRFYDSLLISKMRNNARDAASKTFSNTAFMDGFRRGFSELFTS